MLSEDAVLEDWMLERLWASDAIILQQLHAVRPDEDNGAHLGSQKQLSSPSPSTSGESCKGRPADKDENIAQSELSSKKTPRRVKKLQKSLQPMVALKTRSDTDVLDDGYKWRKYGMKAAKNSKHPRYRKALRSYYRCTIGGCLVKKRVERSTHDAGIVVTTYEGMHNHYPNWARRT